MKAAKEEFKHRFPETWESLTDKQKKHVIYVINGYALKQEHSTLSESKVMEVLDQHQINVMKMSRGEISEGHLMTLINKHIKAICSTVDIAQVGEEEINELIQPHAISLEHGEKAAKDIFELLNQIGG